MTGTTSDPDKPEASPFKRRSFVAAAALAAAPVSLAGPAAAAHAAGPPQAAPFGSVARLMAVPAIGRDVGWLRQALQVAVELELSTIPPYLCGWWSVKDRGSEVARLIRRIVGDEMYHLGVVCNLLVAVGGRPRISDAAPTYPGPLPGGVRAGVNVYLSGLTKSVVHDVMMAIEAPDAPLTRSRATSPSVADFYSTLQQAFRQAAPELSARGQLSEHIGSAVLKPVENLDDVERCLEVIKEQGEGTITSPDESFGDDHPAHYYAFGEIYHGRRLLKVGASRQFTGAPVPFPDTRPMATVPAGGWPHASVLVRRLLDHFDTTYHAVLDTLETAWDGGDPSALRAAVHAMRGLETPAVELMEIGIPGTPGNYGPQFRPPLSSRPTGQ
ncbi:ferritin-like protein [Streptomyces fildesensis]|uniref:ferritin-like domain-containing protein n=1 Tax=Streptomyces fildesensis TaxID=375757 RepID=UPI0027DB2456|nr:ferritin-like protein [Streptomyces fildesensis]